MATLHPQPFAVLFARALAELDAQRTIFEFPRRAIWSNRSGLDLSVELPGGRAGTPLGPAAGPHTQLAQNLVVAWLAGARVLELKTVQVNDRLTIPRPCIDAADVGYNVEWSQELPIETSAEQYAAAWLLVHILEARGIGAPRRAGGTLFDASAGYDFAGIRSAPVARFLDTMGDASALIGRLRDDLPVTLRAAADVDVPVRIVHSVTLSTFHGCPPDEIERIVEHLFERHAMHVVVKLNPTLLGYEAVDALLRGDMGYDEVQLDRAAFEGDLQWDDAIAMFTRLEGAAARAGRTLGAKFTNTLIVRNTRGVLEGDVSYLSGAPLHPIAIRLADRFVTATGGRIPCSFSAGIDDSNVADAIACGFSPVTSVTDLLRPNGYRRLPLQLKALGAAMEATGAASIPAFILGRDGGPRAAQPAAPGVPEAAGGGTAQPGLIRGPGPAGVPLPCGAASRGPGAKRTSGDVRLRVVQQMPACVSERRVFRSAVRAGSDRHVGSGDRGWRSPPETGAASRSNATVNGCCTRTSATRAGTAIHSAPRKAVRIA